MPSNAVLPQAAAVLTDDVLADLDRALALAADALAALPAAAWDALCEEEAAEIIAMKQLFDVEGWPDSYPPERWLGNRIMEIAVARHPEITHR